MNIMKNIINAHALNVLNKTVDKPNQNLGVGNDEKRYSIPILVFTEQYLTQPLPEMPSTNHISYEKAQAPGKGSTLNLEDFETQDFYMGHPFGGVE